MRMIASDEPYPWPDYCFDHYYGDMVVQGEPVALEDVLTFLMTAGEANRLSMAAVLDGVAAMVSCWTGQKWTP